MNGKEGLHRSYQVGRMDSERPTAIRLSGDNILEEHCAFDNNDSKVTIISMPDSITVRTEIQHYLLIYIQLMCFLLQSVFKW